ncbi:hypothetical protein LSM04_008932 [Trypanosoma melophagium]|uniref:uncharacterized protein n=1 Tax=Trypanosoma melophagium TaxID=715481 RepID=UPI00351A3A9E|nr:hypothetical protein LSM04_008932 [Trypanosoma melophagium]
MNHLFDSDDDVHDRPPVKAASQEPLGMWQPTPIPWEEECASIASNVVNIGGAVVHIPTSGITVPQSLEANKVVRPLPSLVPPDELSPAKIKLTKSQTDTKEHEHMFDSAQQYQALQVSNIKSLITLTAEVTVALPDLPPPPEQKIPLQGNPPEIKVLPHTETGGVMESSSSKGDQNPWDAFLGLKKNTEESVTRMKCFYDQMVKLQLTHGQEAASYRDTSESIINQQRKQIDVLTSDYKDALSNNESLKSLLKKKALELMEYQKINHDLNIRLKDAEERCAHC